MEEKNFAVSVEFLNKLLGYLGNRPYVEVAGLIDDVRAIVKKPPFVQEGT